VNIQKLFKPYIVKHKNGQCQILIPLVELDELCDRIEKEIAGKESNRIIEIQMGQDVFAAYRSLFGDVSDGKGFCTYNWREITVLKSNKIMRNEICFVHHNNSMFKILIAPVNNYRICSDELVDLIESYCGPRS